MVHVDQNIQGIQNAVSENIDSNYIEGIRRQ